MSKSLHRICDIQITLAKHVENSQEFLNLCLEQADLLLENKDKFSNEIFIVLSNDAMELVNDRLEDLLFAAIHSADLQFISTIHRRYREIRRLVHQKKFGN